MNFDKKFIHFDESKWPKVNPIISDSLFKAEEDPVFKAIYNYTVKVVDEQESTIMQQIQRIGGENYHTITIDKNKVVDALKMYKTMQWVSVKERLPDKDGRYIVNIGDTYYGHIAIHRYHNKKWHGVQAGSVIEGVTHWMPLPDEPAEVL